MVESEKHAASTEWHLRSTALFLQTSAQIAGVIAHLLSDAERPTSGAAIPVYGRA